MENLVKYKYYFRPAYKSTDLLIEVFSGAENENFGKDFLDAIKTLRPIIVDLKDLWMNNEIILKIGSDLGDFLYSKDIWDFAFVMAENNQTCLAQINLLLMNDGRFEKIEVDFENYK
jgi:hypothetical protein